MELAGRAERLWAAIIDRLILLAVSIGIGVTFSGMHGSTLLSLPFGLCALLMIGVVGGQIWLLTTEGRTLGKKAMGLRIVTIKDMTNGGFTTNVLMRGAIGWVISAVPVAGMFYGLLDPLAIFREDRRCLHDHIAGTCVIKDAADVPAGTADRPAEPDQPAQ